MTPGQRGGCGQRRQGVVVHGSSGTETVVVAGQHQVPELLLLLGVAERARLHVQAARALSDREAGRAQLRLRGGRRRVLVTT